MPAPRRYSPASMDMVRARSRKGSPRGWAAGLGLTVLTVVVAQGCTSSAPPATPPAGATPLNPGEVCDPTTARTVLVHFDPTSVVVAPGAARPVRLVVDPDLCTPVTASFAMGATVATAPSSAPLDLRHPTFDFNVTGMAVSDAGDLPPRTTTLTVSVQRPTDAAPFTGSLPIEVRPNALPPTCSGADSSGMQTLSGTTPTVQGSGNLVDASIGAIATAFARTDELALPSPFTVSIGCFSPTALTPSAMTGDLTPAVTEALLPLGPAVTFTPQDGALATHSMRREIDFAVPVNPATMPMGARMRHLQVLYSGPMARKPRTITVANPHFVKAADGNWALAFESPWFGTYQATVAANAGTVSYTRHLTHRAVMGISMGGGGAAIFGMHHHDQFDAIAPLGGNSDLTWLVWYFEQYKFGGFCPANNPGCTKYAPNLYPLWETYAHTEDFDHWFFQPGGGTGGTFSRNGWTQILEDFAIGPGNPNGQNADPAIPFMTTGPTLNDPFMGGPTCDVTINPIGPDADDSQAMQQQEAVTQMQQQQTQAMCMASRCNPASVWTAKTGFYDATYNPDGSLPVITFCDGGQDGTTPYVDTWVNPDSSDWIPSEVTLAVDLNGNGVRDFGEPVIRQGEEPYTDTGIDGVADANEPGYDPLANPDPNGDDYDFQLNPNGTENDHVYELGEPFEDVGVDGVANTPQQGQGGYDVGEGDGVFTLTTGAQRLYGNDPHSMLHGRTTPPGGPIDATALRRLTFWADGGVRDMANFAATGNHLLGAVASLHESDGTQVRSSAFYNNFENLPGCDPTNPDAYLAVNVLWQDVARAAHMRYGYVDATPAMIALGDGQHVGTATQALDRIVTSFYFTSQAWPDADFTLADSLDTVDGPDAGGNAETTTINSLCDATNMSTCCELAGHCETYFTGPQTQRKGPLGITLPPGYALEANRLGNKRYPVLFVLHGYGQDPRDLEALAAVTGNYQNDSTRSAATRLAKSIAVYVDGRCRIDPVTNEPECIEGTFYVNSNRVVNGHPVGRLDDWFEEVMTYVDQNYRTMGPSDVDVVE